MALSEGSIKTVFEEITQRIREKHGEQYVVQIKKLPISQKDRRKVIQLVVYRPRRFIGKKVVARLFFEYVKEVSEQLAIWAEEPQESEPVFFTIKNVLSEHKIQTNVGLGIRSSQENA